MSKTHSLQSPTCDEIAGMTWWNDALPSVRAHWLSVAGSAVPADAWSAYKAAKLAELREVR